MTNVDSFDIKKIFHLAGNSVSTAFSLHHYHTSASSALRGIMQYVAKPSPANAFDIPPALIVGYGYYHTYISLSETISNQN